MKFTFGIITGGDNPERVNRIIDSIESEEIPEYEVIIVGGEKIERLNTLHIPFDDSGPTRPWITKKKNIITELSMYENIVYMHDYLILLPGWYEGQLLSGSDFTIRMDKIQNADGTRFRDWTLNPQEASLGMANLLPYDVADLTEFMYISGSYWVGKKDFMLHYPLDEKLLWADGEDMEWSKIINKITTFSMNVHSSVKIIKEQKAVVFGYATEEMIKHLRRAKEYAANIESFTT